MFVAEEVLQKDKQTEELEELSGSKEVKQEYTGKKAEMMHYFNNTPSLKAMFVHPLWFIWYMGTQFKGWVLPSYFLVIFTIAWNLEASLLNPTLETIVNSIGMVLGVTCITAINQHKSINGILGIVSAGFIIWSGVMSGDWGAIFQQVAYIIALDIPVLLSKSWMGDKPVTHGLTFKGFAIMVATFLIGTALMYGVITFLGTPRIWENSLLFGISLTASVLSLKKYRVQHIFWIITSLFQVATWGTAFMQGDTTLVMLVGTLIYFTNDIIAMTCTEWWAPYPFNINYWRAKKKGIKLSRK